jgi:hypothetical protein
MGENEWGQTFVFLSHLSYYDSVGCGNGVSDLNDLYAASCAGDQHSDVMRTPSCGNAAPGRRTCFPPTPQSVPPGPQCVAPSPHVWRSLSAMRRPVATRVAVAVRNASPRRRTCGGRCPQCVAPSLQCVAPSPQVRRCLSAMRRPVAARVAVAVRNASSRRRTCGGRCPQCVAPSPHVRRSLSAMRRPVAAGAAVPCRNASPRRRRCGGPLPQCVASASHVRRRPPQRVPTVSHVRPAGGGVGYLLLPRALEVCTRLGKHQPGESARGRDFQPVAARTCRPVARPAYGLRNPIRPVHSSEPLLRLLPHILVRNVPQPGRVEGAGADDVLEGGGTVERLLLH